MHIKLVKWSITIKTKTSKDNRHSESYCRVLFPSAGVVISRVTFSLHSFTSLTTSSWDLYFTFTPFTTSTQSFSLTPAACGEGGRTCSGSYLVPFLGHSKTVSHQTLRVHYWDHIWEWGLSQLRSLHCSDVPLLLLKSIGHQGPVNTACSQQLGVL